MEFLILFFLVTIISNIILIKSESVIFLPLKRDETINDGNFDISQLANSKIYTEINIGNPKQKVKIYLSFDYYLTYIFDKEVNGFYNPKASKSYENISKSFYYSTPFENGFISNETIYLETYNNSIKEISDFSFDLITQLKENTNLKGGIMGLKLFDNTYRGDPVRNMIVQLKKRHIIESYGWSIKFKENGEGVLGIGAYPHEYDHINYQVQYFKQIVSGYRTTGLYWIIDFTNIITGYGTYIEKTRKCEMQIETGLIFGSDEYFELVKKEFFDEKISKEECFLDNTSSSGNIYFKYFYCKNYDTIKEFKGIHFKQNDLSKDFFFDYNDLFINKNNKYYFLIAFKPSANTNWIIGYPFFKKFEFVFQPDGKLIGTYFDYPKNNNNNESNNKGMNASMILLICMVGVLVIIVLILLYLLYKLITKKLKKKRANELDDNFDYTRQKDDNKIINE